MTRRFYKNRKWLTMVALCSGTALQVAACQDDLALFGVRVAFSSITLPINQFIRDVLLILT